ncbi:hypothetical protein LTR64_006048 [Lithohypha guttulata]|uniref:uncharacterized protein n=1 Tax=Lithohypha guttulata TaxID=1690604 RepID=UPI002DDE56C7|nr:hypothetical protein LTR51_002154 [Lithohypha guttulata]
MTTGPTLTEIQLPPKDSNLASTGSRLLSKIARSPTTAHRHRPVPSQGSDYLPDTLSPASGYTQGAINSRRNQPRPGFQRQISAPDTSVLRLLPGKSVEPKHHSDASAEIALQAKAMLQRQPTNNAPIHTTTTVSAKGLAQASMFSAPPVSEYYVPAGQSAAQNSQVTVNYMYQQLYEMSQKRIATLQYMRRAHEGSTFWFNTVHFSKSDVSRLPSYTPSRLAKRAMNCFLLGISIPAVLDIHQMPHPSSSPHTNLAAATEYLKSLNNLLAEFESYQERHPTDGTQAGSLSRARLPSMFKRSGTTSRPRKSSSAPSIEIGAQISPPAVPDTPYHPVQHSSHPSLDTTATTSINTSFNSTTSTAPTLNSQASFGSAMAPSMNDFSATATFPSAGPTDAPNSTLLPNEALYTYLLTPPLPFAPDFYTVFATLCDVLIDTYQRILQIINGPGVCSGTVSELFTKADARIRKVMVSGIVRDYEGAARETAKKELNGIQKVVLGGLMG